MRERAMLIGAQLTIDGPPDGGTEVRLVLPPDEAIR
jgi:signal transduction histidine kinase